jgi:hypothetical protein
MDFKETGWGGMDSIDLAFYRKKWQAFVSPIIKTVP